MKRRTEIVVIGVLAVAAAVFAMKRGGRSECGSGSGRACCPQMPEMNAWPTNPWTGLGTLNTNAGAAVGGAVTNGQQ